MNAEQASHGVVQVKSVCQGDVGKSPVFAPVSEVRAQLHDAARFRARSTSHSVAGATEMQRRKQGSPAGGVPFLLVVFIADDRDRPGAPYALAEQRLAGNSQRERERFHFRTRVGFGVGSISGSCSGHCGAPGTPRNTRTTACHAVP